MAYTASYRSRRGVLGLRGEDHGGGVMGGHETTFAPFCPGISTHPTIDYDGVAESAFKSYPGAKDKEQALVFALKHTQMRLYNAVLFYSNQAHQKDQADYQAGWIERCVEYLGGQNSTDQPDHKTNEERTENARQR